MPFDNQTHKPTDKKTAPKASIGGCQSTKDTNEQKVKDATKPFKPTKSEGLTKLQQDVLSHLKIKVKPFYKDFTEDGHVRVSWFSDGYAKTIDMPADMLELKDINQIGSIKIENPFVVQYEKGSHESFGGIKYRYMRLGKNDAKPTKIILEPSINC